MFNVEKIYLFLASLPISSISTIVDTCSNFNLSLTYSS